MASESKNTKHKSRKLRKRTIKGTARDYSNEPFFIEKADKAQKFLEKHGFPEFPDKKKKN